MKDSYRYGELVLSLREEYKQCENILEELKECVSIDDNGKSSNYYFSGNLADDIFDRRIKLIVEHKLYNIKKKILRLRYGQYSQGLYKAPFLVEKNKNGNYSLSYDEIASPIRKKNYIPKVEITNNNKFSNLIKELSKTDLMNTELGDFNNNFSSIILNFDNAFITTPLGKDSYIYWSGINDRVEYSTLDKKDSFLISDILSLEMPTYKISKDWLKILSSHENIKFIVDNIEHKKGEFEVSDNGNVKELKKINKH